MTTQGLLFDIPRAKARTNLAFNPKEFKVQCLRECPVPSELLLCNTPQVAAEYWRTHVVQHPYFNSAVECFIVLLLNTRRRAIGHNLVATGLNDTILVHPREVFRCAIVASAAAVVLMHNHPSGDSTPSEADIKVTRDLIRAGQLLKIEVLDHVVIGQPDPKGNGAGFTSLRELGYWAGY